MSGKQEPVPVTGVWLRVGTENDGGEAEVLVEVGGEWRLAITDQTPGPISHIAEQSAILAGLTPGYARSDRHHTATSVGTELTAASRAALFGSPS